MAAKPKSHASAETSNRAGTTRVIKKYPNRRLYDTLTSSYVTLADVKKLVIAGTQIKVLDVKTEDDLTRSMLLQIILEEEAAGMPMFSEPMLYNLIRSYGHAQQSVMGQYFEQVGNQMTAQMQQFQAMFGFKA